MIAAGTGGRWAAFLRQPIQFVTLRHQPSFLKATQWRHSYQTIQHASIMCRRQFSGHSARYHDCLVRVPPMAESISEGTIVSLHKGVGDLIKADEEFASIETDKIDVAVNAAEEGVIVELLAQEGDVVTVGQSLARIQKSPIVEQNTISCSKASESTSELENQKPTDSKDATQERVASGQPTQTEPTIQANHSPANQPEQIAGHAVPARVEREEKISRMRKTIATRLKQSQNICASLTTVQEVDMTALLQWRAKYKDEVAEKHGVRLGYMGAFAKAAALAAKQVPQINASIDAEREIITYRDYVDISIAVSSPKGLVTPVVKDCDMLSIVELEGEIAVAAQKARESKLTMEDLTGGNFSISNPGIFNSLFGTPIINYPQAAVFNMNTIKDRVVAVNGKPEIRPMMYITVTYDHRLIDGREAVSFLNFVKNYIEDPARMLLE